MLIVSNGLKLKAPELSAGCNIYPPCQPLYTTRYCRSHCPSCNPPEYKVHQWPWYSRTPGTWADETGHHSNQPLPVCWGKWPSSWSVWLADSRRSLKTYVSFRSLLTVFSIVYSLFTFIRLFSWIAILLVSTTERKSISHWSIRKGIK